MKLVKSKNTEIILPYSETLEDVTAFSWYKMQEENDVNWLRIGFNGRQSKIKDSKLDEIRKQLEDEAFKLIDNDNFKIILAKRMEINYYNDLYAVVTPILYRMSKGFQNDQTEDRLKYIHILKKLKFKMPEINSYDGDLKEIDRLFQQAQGIKTKIQLLADDIKVEGKKETRSLNKEMMIVGQVLNIGYMLDSKVLSQAYWIELQKLAYEINENNKRKE